MPSESTLPAGTTKFLMAMLLHDAVTRRDTRSARALLDRLTRMPKPIPIALPNGLATAKDIATAAQALLQAVARGDVTPTAAQKVASVLEHARKAVETEDLERRILDLEERAKRKPK